ncbi:hypothetical protein Tco_1500521 [Tanacetum coccineum]
MAPSDSLFLIFDVHYDGSFNFCPLRYENGLVYQWSVRKDNPLDLASCDLDVGLKIIENERDLEAMYDYALEFGIIHVYITHGPQDLAPYYVENMCFYGSEDDLKPRKTVTKDAGNMSLEDLVSWAEEEAAMSSKASDVDICVTSVLDKGKGLADKGKGLADKGKGIMVYEGKAGRKTARSRNNGIVIGENVNPSVSEDDDSDSDIEWEQRVKGNAELEEMYVGISDSESEYSDKSVDHLSEGEDELISLRKRNSEAKKNRNHSNKNSNTPVAGCSRPNRVYGVGETATVIEHEEYMDILMHQLRGKNDGLLDPFTFLENDQSNDRYPIHDDQTHWKIRKPKVGEKYVDAAQLKECLTYYALANGFSLWLYRSSKEMIIARYGKRPEKLKSIQKGKQRKHLKYPSSGRNEGSNFARSGSTSSARGRGRGRGGQTLGVRYASLGRWFGIRDDTQKESNDQSTPLTQQSQAGIQQTPKDGRNAEGNQNIRPRSARIMEKRLSRSNDVTGSSKTNDQS